MSFPCTIQCPEPLGGCGTICVEVGHVLGYPKSTGGPWPSGKEAKEHRFVCPGCGREWIYMTKWKDIYPVPGDARFRIRLTGGKEIIETEDRDILTYWGLPIGRRARLTPEEVVDLDKRASRKSYQRVSGKREP